MKTRPLASVFLRRMIFAYLGFALIIASFQLALEYRKAKKDIIATLDSLAETFTPGAISAIWDYQANLLQALTNGFGANKYVVFVQISAKSSDMVAEWRSSGSQKESPELTVRHELYIERSGGQKRHVGTMLIGSSQNHVYALLMDAFMHTISVILMVLFFLGLTLWLLVRILVVRPLSDFSGRVAELATTGSGKTIELGSVRISEIKTMQDGFNRLMDQISESHDRIAEQNAMLEQRVLERTKQVVEKEARFRSIFERANAGIAFVDLKGNFVQVNDSFCELLGYGPEELMGMKVEDITHPDDFVHEIAAVRKMASGGMDDYRMEKRYLKKNGETLWGDLSLAAIHGESGQASNFVGLVIDITNTKLAAEELMKAKQIAESAARSKSEFLANMSHEIRTPLNGILGMAELVMKTELNPKQQDYLFKIKKAGRSLIGIINDILDFSKIEAGRLKIDTTEFSIDSIKDAITDLLAKNASDKGIELIISIDRSIPDRLIGDPLRLSQVLINLTSNAVKFTEKGSVLVLVRPVQMTKKAVTLNFSVRDTGIGIDPDKIPLLFQPFTQADGSTTRRFGGTGLGLSISKQLVVAMGGELTVDSTLSMGSTFFFSLTFGIASKEEAVAPISNDLGGLRGIIVDDDDFSREMLLKELGSLSLNIKALSSGEEALKEIVSSGTSDPYRFAILDWIMPGIDGITLASEIRSLPGYSDLPIIMMSAYTRESAMTTSRRAGVDAFLLKPISQSVLHDTIVEVLSRRGLFPSELPESEPDYAFAKEKLSGSKILLVEDNDLNQEVAAGILDPVGALIDFASNGKDAVEAIYEKDYDAVLMDVHMPVMDGFEATRLIRSDERFKALPIIAMTANALDGDRENCLSFGMSDYVVKPIDPQILFDTLIKWIKPRPSEKVLSEKNDKKIKNDLKLPFDLYGIDVKSALKRLRGDSDLLITLLIGFESDYAGALQDIRANLKAGDHDKAKYLIHTLKGITGNLSAKKLYSLLSDLETSLAGDVRLEGCLDEVEAELSAVMDGLRSLREFSAAGSKRKSESPGSEYLEPARLDALLGELSISLMSNNIRAVKVFEALMIHLPASIYPDLISRLEKEIYSLDFVKALKTFDDLTSAMNISIKEKR